jgi:alcohol dehydrogenase class IV
MKHSFTTIDKKSVCFSPTKTILGRGVLDQIGDEILALRGTKVLIVTDPGIVETGLVERIQDTLNAQNVRQFLFDNVKPEPPASQVDEVVRVIRSEKCDLVIGFGGGSALDVAKGAAALTACEGGVLDYVGLNTLERRGIPRILVPTTAGTGSEAGTGIVLTDEAENTKKVVVSPHLLADTAILDPDLTLSMPPKVTAATGLDALVHAIESYTSCNATPYSDLLSLQSISLIARHLPIAFAKGSDPVARYNMLLAANWAGAAFTSGGLAAVHALAYILGTEYHLPHGIACAIMLPHVMSFNAPGNLEKFSRIAEAMGENISGITLYESAEKSVNAVKKLMETVNVSFRFSDYDISSDALPHLVEGGMAQSRLFAANPRDLSEMDVRGIYESAFFQTGSLD